MKRICSFLMAVLTVVLLLSAFCINAFAETTSKQNCIGYIYMDSNYRNSNAGKSTYQIKYFNIPANKKVTIEAFWFVNKKYTKLTNQKCANLKLKDYLRFDIQIIDKNSGAVVNGWNSLKSGDKFKVFSAVPKIQTNNYQVKVVSYLYNYKTYVHSSLAGAATGLKYDLKY